MARFRLPFLAPKAAPSLEDLERTVCERMMNEAVKQRFDGGLRVDPSKVYIDSATGKRALDALGKLPRARR